MASVTKTLSVTITGTNYPYTYTWSTPCSGITFSTPTGTSTSGGVITTNITYDNTNCLDCNFSVEISSVNDVECTDIQTNNFKLTCGTITLIHTGETSASSSATITVNGNNSCTATIGNSCTFYEMFGIKDIEVSLGGCSNMATVTVNGVTQTNFGSHLFVFSETLDFTDPNILVECNCY